MLSSSPNPRLRPWTRDEYERMVQLGILGPSDRVELVEGQILTMSPERSRHSAAVDLAVDALRAAFGAGHYVRVQHPLALGKWSEPEPDVAVVVGGPRDYADAHPSTAELVVEVADTSLEIDRTDKQRLYASAAIGEYWIVNLRDGVLEVYRSATEDKYRDVTLLQPTQTVEPLAAPGAKIRVVDLLP